MPPLSPPKLYVPALTFFDKLMNVHSAASLAFCRWLIDQGADLAVFGTNSEAASLSLREKLDFLDTLVQAGIPPARLLPGTGLSALPETIQLTRAAVECGCIGTLVLPPHYFKPVSEDGLFAYYAEVIQAVGSERLKIYLYHIPQFTGVPISYGLIERLLKTYPAVIAGLKDSSGDWAYTARVLTEFKQLQVFPASESLLGQSLPMGAAGCISATANIQPALILATMRAWGSEQFALLEAQVTTVRQIFQAQAMIPALKYVAAHHLGSSLAARVRPPLMPLNTSEGQALLSRLTAAGYAWGQASL